MKSRASAFASQGKKIARSEALFNDSEIFRHFRVMGMGDLLNIRLNGLYVPCRNGLLSASFLPFELQKFTLLLYNQPRGWSSTTIRTMNDGHNRTNVKNVSQRFLRKPIPAFKLLKNSLDMS